MKLTRKRSTGKPYAAFDEAGAGNGLKGTAPVLDPTTREGRAGNSSALLYTELEGAIGTVNWTRL